MENTPLTSIRVSDQTFQKLQEAVANSEMSVTEIRRHALSLGLDALKRINYDVEGFLSASLDDLVADRLVFRHGEKLAESQAPIKSHHDPIEEK